MMGLHDIVQMSSSASSGFELVANNLSFPTGFSFDDTGAAYVAESGLPFGGAPAGGRILRLTNGGERELVATKLRAPVNGVTWYRGGIYVSEGGHPGRISRFEPDGRQTVILDNLPGPGNYHTNMVAFGPDAKLYFSQGAMTNTGIVGLDAYEIGWLRRLPHAHDVPGFDVTLAGFSAETDDPVRGGPLRAVTGAFSPFGTAAGAGTRIKKSVPCTAAVMRCDIDGSHLELVAWGLRNAYGLGFLADGRLLATDQGADDRGSRPLGDVPDLLHVVKEGAWYGWPDYIGNIPVTHGRFTPERGAPPAFVLADHSELPPPEGAVLEFPAHCGALKFTVVPGEETTEEDLIVALFGDERPMVAPAGPRAGRGLARVRLRDWSIRSFLAGPLHRPIDVAFRQEENALYVLDFGEFEMGEDCRVIARPGTGRLCRICLRTFERLSTAGG